MNDAVSDQHIRRHNLRGVDEDVAILNVDGQVCTIDGSQHGVVLEPAAVAYSALDNMVGENSAKVVGAQVSESRTNRLESSVGRSEDSNIF